MLIRYGTEVGSCEYGIATADSRTDADYVDLRRVYCFFNKVSNPQSSYIYIYIMLTITTRFFSVKMVCT
jgi:hypothetical protein